MENCLVKAGHSISTCRFSRSIKFNHPELLMPIVINYCRASSPWANVNSMPYQ